ncbi:mitochondrial presequence protease [Acrasis kona]|uniref:Mitochondrial presequence protease n=1 Tax=Acrasis kona TaxID=1008807 RepID=A0AAW2ZQ28_9EUKA
MHPSVLLLSFLLVCTLCGDPGANVGVRVQGSVAYGRRSLWSEDDQLASDSYVHSNRVGPHMLNLIPLPLYSYSNNYGTFMSCHLDCETVYTPLNASLFKCPNDFRFNSYGKLVKPNVVTRCPSSLNINQEDFGKAISLCKNENKCELTKAGAALQDARLFKDIPNFGRDWKGQNENRPSTLISQYVTREVLKKFTKKNKKALRKKLKKMRKAMRKKQKKMRKAKGSRKLKLQAAIKDLMDQLSALQGKSIPQIALNDKLY